MILNNSAFMTSTSLKREIVQWINRQGYWKKYLCAKILEEGTPGEEIIKKVYQYFCQENQLVEESLELDPIPDLEKAYHIDEDAAFQDLKLMEIREVENVCALVEGQRIELCEQLTIIYGENGAGKSSYVRLFNNTFSSRGDKNILPNIRGKLQDEPLKPSGTFVFHANGEEFALKYPDNEGHEVFNRFSVFDSASVLVHLDGKNELYFTPHGFEFFNFLIDALEKLTILLEENIAQRRYPNELTTLFHYNQEIIEAIQSLSADTEINAIEQLAELSEQEQQELVQLEKAKANILAEEVEIKLKQKNNLLKNITGLVGRIENLNRYFSGERMEEIKRKISEIHEKRQTAERVSEKQFETAMFNGVGSKEWKGFIEAAYHFTREHNNNYLKEADSCLFCRQPLSGTSQSLVKKYWEFIESTAQKDLELAMQELTRLKSEYNSLNVEMPDDGTVVYQYLEANTPELLEELNGQFKDLEKILAEVIGAIEQEKADWVFKGYFLTDTFLLELVEKVKNDIKKLEGQNSEEELEKLSRQIEALKERTLLAQYLKKVEAFVEDRKWIREAGKAQTALNSRGVTIQQRKLFEQYITSDYVQTFEKECKRLNAELGISVSQEGRKGTTLRELKISDYPLRRVLSEGEQRAISFADFLTEIQASPFNRGLIFDDPVNSLDHNRKHLFAERLVAEARRRQIVVFTHDLMFVHFLKNEVAKAEVEQRCHWIQKHENDIGRVYLDNSPSNEADFKSSKIARNWLEKAKAVGPENKEYFLKLGFAALRSSYEALIMFEVFAGVVLRFEERISPGRLKEVIADEDIIQIIIDKHGELSRYIPSHLHSDHYSFEKPTIGMLNTEIEEFDALKSRIKNLKKEKVKQG